MKKPQNGMFWQNLPLHDAVENRIDPLVRGIAVSSKRIARA
ncbi:hypothetical protein [Burkholderia cepacia]|nr:hypothetical protein [Burkholderia cepacia]MDN7615857.1 hypothetical protein [Burkholderia cepacia]MDN7766356.1 hypothetical protein [Burkholderia cepacia]MDN7894141.1 hypothetical protein [Burkholderia cepacia]